MFAAIVQAEVSPAPNISENKHMFFDYLIIIAILDCLFCCTDLLLIGSARYAVGFLIIVLTFLSIIVHLVVLGS